MSMEITNLTLDSDYDDEESLLLEVPVNLLKENLLNQFNSPSKYNGSDIIRGFIQNYKYTKADTIEEEDEEGMIDLERIRSDFISFVLMLFSERFGIGMPDIEDASEDEQDELLHFTYRFFIMNIKKNFTNVICNYIDQHSDELALGEETKTKEITTIAYQKELDEPYLQIISNLADIIDYILSDVKENYTVKDFLLLCDGKIPSLETQIVSTAFDEDRLTGNFVGPYVDSVTDSLKFEIEIKARNILFNHFRKRIVKESEEGVSDIQEES